MLYEEIVDSIIELRNQCDDLFDNNGSNEEIVGVVTQIKELIDQAMIDDFKMVIDKMSVYEYMADCLNDLKQYDTALEYYNVAIELGCGISDDNRMDFEILEEIYKKYIALRYFHTGNDSKDLEDDIFQHVKHSKGLREEALEMAESYKN